MVKSVKTEETNKAGYCIICKIKYTDKPKFNFVPYDVCDRMCVPQYRKQHIKGTIDKYTSFECHICFSKFYKLIALHIYLENTTTIYIYDDDECFTFTNTDYSISTTP